MRLKTTALASSLLTAFLTGCGGGGGSATSQTASYPLRTGVMNVYGVAWQKSGTISGSVSTTCLNPPPGTGGACISSVTGTFTNTVTLGTTITLGGVTANQVSVNRVIVTNVSGGSTVSYQLGVKPDYSAIVDASGCAIPIPEAVSIGYTAILSCPNGSTSNGITLSVTADTSSGDAVVTVTSAFGKEVYRLSANGSVTPVSIGPFSGTRDNGYTSYAYTLFY